MLRKEEAIMRKGLTAYLFFGLASCKSVGFQEENVKLKDVITAPQVRYKLQMAAQFRQVQISPILRVLLSI